MVCDFRNKVATAGVLLESDRSHFDDFLFQTNRLERKDAASAKSAQQICGAIAPPWTSEAPVSKKQAAGQRASGCFCGDFNHIISSATSSRAPRSAAPSLRVVCPTAVFPRSAAVVEETRNKSGKKNKTNKRGKKKQKKTAG